MSINPLNDISRVYLEQVASQEVEIDEGMTMKDFKQQRSRQKQKEKRAAEKTSPLRRAGIHADKASPERAARHRANVDPDYDYGDEEQMYPGGKLKNPKKIRKAKALGELGEGSHLETDMKKRAEANEKARKEMMKTKAYKDMVATVRKKFDEAMDPVGQEDADIDNDGDTDKTDKYLHKRRKAIGNAISKRKGVKEAKGYYDPMEDPDFDPREAEKTRGVSGKNNPKGGKSLGKKKSVKEGFSNWRQDLSEVMNDIEDNKKIKEKKINNKIKINPNIGEAVENIGGTLLEMVEIDEVDYIIESAYDELLDDGYEEDDIEEALEYALIEAKVTFGHDTPTEKKRSGLLSAARQKLASKVGGAKKAMKKAVASGARKVAKSALDVARKIEAGDKKPQTVERKPSTYRGAGVGTKEKVSSGSYKAPEKKKAETVSDPWEGSYKKSSEVKAKTKKTSAPKAKAPARKKKSKLDDLLASVRSESVHIDEKTLSAAETKKKEEIVKSMKDKAADFEKRYPGRGKEVMYATATKMAKKMSEQAMELQPKSQQSSQPEKSDQQQKKLQQQQDRMRQQEVQILQRKLQTLRSAPKGSDPSIMAGYEPEGEIIDERRKEDKVAGTSRKPRDLAFELVAKSMGAGRMGVQPRGIKKQKGAPTPGPVNPPAQKVQKRRDAAQRAQDMMHSRFD
jgi:hypothetical protein